MSTKLELTAEVIDIGTEGACVILHTDGGLLCLSPTDCINLSRALVKAAATVLGVGKEETASGATEHADPTWDTGERR